MFQIITLKVLKASIESCSEALTQLFKNTILTSNFQDKLKVADVSPIFKPQKSKNDRPVSVFPVVSKVFKRLLHKQMSFHLEEYLSPYKAFDSLNHNLLTAKLHTYGFSEESLRLIQSYLTNRWQRTKVNTSFSKGAYITYVGGGPNGFTKFSKQISQLTRTQA